MPNPFSLLFGKPPVEIVERRPQADLIMDSFCTDPPANQINLISGVRGAGKTVFMTELAHRFREKRDWVVVDLNPDRDLLQGLAAKLNSERHLSKLFQRAKINLSLFGLGVEIDGEPPVVDIEVAISRMLESMKKDEKKLLITVDEVSNTSDMRSFVSAFQILIRNDLPVYLLMTGLYKNISSIRNSRTLTFLERAPRTELQPLDQNLMTARYMEALGIGEAPASRLARETRGYSFAFQVLGYYAWENPDAPETAIARSQQYLNEFAYAKIWSELSAGDRRVVKAAAEVPGGEILSIRDRLGCSSDQFNPYRARLIREGILNGSQRGKVAFTLPGFEAFARNQD